MSKRDRQGLAPERVPLPDPGSVGGDRRWRDCGVLGAPVATDRVDALNPRSGTSASAADGEHGTADEELLWPGQRSAG
jgi:hypothetical protein